MIMIQREEYCWIKNQCNRSIGSSQGLIHDKYCHQFENVNCAVMFDQSQLGK